MALLATAMLAECGTAQVTLDAQPASYILTFTTTSRLDGRPHVTRDGVLTMRVLDGRARIDFPPDGGVGMMPGAYFVYDARRARGTFVLPAQRAFVVFDSVGMVDSIPEGENADQARFPRVTAFDDSLGAGETIEGFTSLKFRTGTGGSPLIDGPGASRAVRIELLHETHVSEAIAALDPAFSALLRSLYPWPKHSNRAAPFAGDTAMQRAHASTRRQPGFPILTRDSVHIVTDGDTSTATNTIRLASFTRAPVNPDDLRVPMGFVALDMTGLTRMQRAMIGTARGVAVPPR